MGTVFAALKHLDIERLADGIAHRRNQIFLGSKTLEDREFGNPALLRNFASRKTIGRIMGALFQGGSDDLLIDIFRQFFAAHGLRNPRMP